MPEPGVRRGRGDLPLDPPAPHPDPVLCPPPRPPEMMADPETVGQGPGPAALLPGSSCATAFSRRCRPCSATPSPLPMGSLLAKLTARYQGLTPQKIEKPRGHATEQTNPATSLRGSYPSNLTPPGTRISGTSCALRPEHPKTGPPGPAASGDAVPRVLGAAQTLGAGAIHLPRAGPIPSPPRPQESYAFLGTPTSWIGKSAATPRIWVEAASSSPTHASPGTRASGTAWVRRHKRFGATPQNLGAGRIHSARAGPMGRRSPKKKDIQMDVLLFLERVTRLELAPKSPGKLCFPGDLLPPGLKNPRLHRGFGWRQRIRASPAHASPGTRVSGTAWVRRHKRFGATPQNLGAGRIHPPEHVQ